MIYPTIIWNRTKIKKATGPLVYILWGKTPSNKSICLYVGMTSHGLTRPLCPTHKQHKILLDRADRIAFIPCETTAEATELEIEKIKYLKPVYNIRRKW